MCLALFNILSWGHSDPGVTAATILLVVVGGVQIIVFLRQLKLIRLSLKPAEEAAKAAQDSAQVAHRVIDEAAKRDKILYRAYISGGGVLESREIERPLTNVPTIPYSVKIETVRERVLTGRFELHINNYGRTPGELIEYGIGFCEEGKVPLTPDYKRKSHHDWIQPGRGHRPIDWIQMPEGQPIVYGRFYYRDVFGEEHSCGFIQHGATTIPAPEVYTSSD